VDGRRGERGCRTCTISVLQDARRQNHEVTESITVTSFTLRLILQFYVLNFAARRQEKTKDRVFQVAKQLTTRQLQWNSRWLSLVLQWRFKCRYWQDRVRCGDDIVWFVGKNLKWGGSQLLECAYGVGIQLLRFRKSAKLSQDIRWHLHNAITDRLMTFDTAGNYRQT